MNKTKIAYGVIGVLILDRIAFAYAHHNLTKKAETFAKKAEVNFEIVRVLCNFVPDEKFEDVYRAIETDPFVNYHK